MPRGSGTAKTNAWSTIHAEVTGFHFAVSFGAGGSVRWRSEPWSESMSVEIAARFIDFDYKGFRDLAMTLYGDREFEDSDHRKRSDDDPLKSAGLLNFHGDMLRAFIFMPIPIFRHACFVLVCDRPVFLQLTVSPMKRRESTIQSIRMTTDRSELE